MAKDMVLGAVDSVPRRVLLPGSPVSPSWRDLGYMCCLKSVQPKTQCWGRVVLGIPPTRFPGVLCRGHMSCVAFILRLPGQGRSLLNTNRPVDCDKNFALKKKQHYYFISHVSPSYFFLEHFTLVLFGNLCFRKVV